MRRSIRFVFVVLVVVAAALPTVAQQFPEPLQQPFNVESLWPQLMKLAEVHKELETQLAQVNTFLTTEVAAFNKKAAEHGSSTLFAGGPIQIKPGAGAASSASTGNQDEEEDDQD